MWKAIYDENVNDKISFEILSKDMEQGFPGNLKVSLTSVSYTQLVTNSIF